MNPSRIQPQAKLLDREGNTKTARVLLLQVVAGYPQHPLQPELLKWIPALDALSQQLAGRG